MELKTAIEILEYHQEWRLGKREDMIHEPKKWTEALDIVLNEVKKLEASITNVSISLPSDDIVREAANNYAFNRYYEQENPYDTTVTDFEEGIKWIYRYIKRQ